MRRSNRFTVVGLVLVGIALVGLLGCGDAGGRAKTRPVTLLLFGHINEGNALNSDVYDHASNSIFEDQVEIQIDAVDPAPDDPETAPDRTTMMDVILEEYRVEFTRTDTGTAVPASFTEKINYYVPLGESATFNIVVVRADQKTMIPLSYLDYVNSFGYEPETGLRIIHCTATITIRGRTVSGHGVSAKGYLPVYFADWAEE
jgi:hypothetical protein